MRYVRLYADDDGETHFEDVEVPMELVDYATHAPAAYVSQPVQASRVLYIRLPGGDGTTPAFESHMSKYRSLMPSLALIFHLVDVVGEQEQGPVGLQSTLLAANWCDYLEEHARKIYASELYPDLTTAHLLANKIRAGAIIDEMRVRDIYRPQWSGLTVPEVGATATAGSGTGFSRSVVNCASIRFCSDLSRPGLSVLITIK